MKPVQLSARDGHPLSGYHFDTPGAPNASFVIAPAMAVPQLFYVPFAQYLATRGFAVWTFDYRGTGKSLRGSMRGAKANLTDWYSREYDAVLQVAVEACAGKPLFAVGHSFGGQCAPLLPSRDRLAGLVNIAVGSGSGRHLVSKVRRSAPFMWHLMAPVLCPLFGYFPGSRIGVVGDVPTGAMFQWRRWCLTPDYILSGEPGARDAYATAEFPVLGLTFADDELLLEDGSRMLHDAYKKQPADYRFISPAEVGLKRVGHFGFFKPQSETALWPVVTTWLDVRIAAHSGTTAK